MNLSNIRYHVDHVKLGLLYLNKTLLSYVAEKALEPIRRTQHFDGVVQNYKPVNVPLHKVIIRLFS